MSSPDIVGIGAVNLDYIIDPRTPDDRALPALTAETRGAVDNALAAFDYGSERAIGDDDADRLLAALAPLQPRPGPGGSALNTMASIAAMRSGTSVGYVGVCGTGGGQGFSFQQWLVELAIDTAHLAMDPGPPGICMSYTERGRRSLLTTQGANRSIMDHLEANAESLIDHLRGAAVVLATSFADLTDVTPLAEILEAVAATPGDRPRLCCDPGALWSNEPLPTGTERVVGACDVLLVNAEEFRAWAPRLAEHDPTTRPTVIRKRADRIDVFSGHDHRAPSRTHHNDRVLSDAEVVDDTGAGDAFAAGYLLALATALSDDDGIELGFRLAGEKLRWRGLDGAHRYAGIYQRLVSQRRA